MATGTAEQVGMRDRVKVKAGDRVRVRGDLECVRCHGLVIGSGRRLVAGEVGIVREAAYVNEDGAPRSFLKMDFGDRNASGIDHDGFLVSDRFELV